MLKKVPDVVEQLKTAIRESGMPLNQIEKASGVGREQLSRFLHDKRSLALPAVAKLCQALGYQLTKVEAPAPKKKAPGRPKGKDADEG